MNPCATSWEFIYCKVEVDPPSVEFDEPSQEKGEPNSDSETSSAQCTSFLGVAAIAQWQGRLEGYICSYRCRSCKLVAKGQLNGALKGQRSRGSRGTEFKLLRWQIVVCLAVRSKQISEKTTKSDQQRYFHLPTILHFQ